MDEKLKTQTFRFTNQFKTGENGENNESNVIDINVINMVPDASDEDSIEEEICGSQGSFQCKKPKKKEPVINESIEILKKI